MKDQVISFETAKLAKEKGFNEYTLTQYTQYGDICNTESVLGSKIGKYPILSQSLLQKWLREIHGIHVFCHCDINYNKESKYNYRLQGEYNLNLLLEWTYEEALEAGLQEALTLI